MSMRSQIIVTFTATLIAIAALILFGSPDLPAAATPAPVSDAAVLVPQVGEPAPVVPLDPAQSCAYDVQITLDDLAEGYSATGEGMPVPNLTWDAAVRLCRGTLPDGIMFADGSFIIADTDHEYPLFRACMVGDECGHSTTAPLAWDVFEDGSYVGRQSGLPGCVPGGDCND